MARADGREQILSRRSVISVLRRRRSKLVRLALAVGIGASVALSASAVAVFAEPTAAMAGMRTLGNTKVTPTPMTALIDGDSVTTVDGIENSSSTPISLEEYAADQLGYTVTVVSGTTWDSMTAAQFAAYQLLIVGDPYCNDTSATAISNASTWAPVVMGTSGVNTAVGNRTVIGTDPEYHYANGLGNAQPTNPSDPSTAGAEHLVQSGEQYAGQAPGATGVYFDTSCFDPASGGTGSGGDLSVLQQLTIASPSSWSLSDADTSPAPPCGGSVSFIASNPAFSGVSDTDIQGWQCSDHVTFPTFPTDWNAIAVATDTATTPTCGTDPYTMTNACGQAYVLVSGTGIVSSSTLCLTPTSGSSPAGATNTHTVTATVYATGTTCSGATVPKQLVSFAVSGQNSGVPGTCAPTSCVTNSSGQVTFTYPDTNLAGTDQINGSFTSGGITSSATASWMWTTSTKTSTTVSTSLSGGGHTGTTISVPTGTAVTDSAALAGTNASTATGTITYDVYSNSTCTTAVSTGTPESIVNPGTPPSSSAVTLSAAGTFYWQASYSGDAKNDPSASTCGSEVEKVGSVVAPDVNDIIQVETSPLFEGKTVVISSAELESKCTQISFETLQRGTPKAPVVRLDSIPVVLDSDGNVTVVLNGVSCQPGRYTIDAKLKTSKTITATTTLVIDPPQVTYPDQVVGYPANEVETGNTPQSGKSDVYTVFLVETSPKYAERTAKISSAELLKACGEGSRWESNGPGSPYVNDESASAIIDDDGNAEFVFKGASCRAGAWTVSVTAGKSTYTTTYDIDPPAVTYTGPKNSLFVSASPNPLILVGN
jgi:hypothetical protein